MIAALNNSKGNARANRKLLKTFFRGLLPTKRISVSAWAENYRILGEGVSNLGGTRWKNDKTPYLKAIMDCLGVFSRYKEVIFEKGTQIGATSAGENCVGYWIHITPDPILIMYPTVNVAKRNSKRRLQSLIEDTPELRRLVGSSKSRNGNNTILEKKFRGGTIMLCGANSPSDLRSVNIRFEIFDEIDEYPIDLADQGDPIEIAKRRTNTYEENKKMFFISTPTIKGASHIDALYSKTDQHNLYLACPLCCKNAAITGDTFEEQFAKEPPKGYFKLVLGNFVFTANKPELTYYKCPHCKGAVYNHDKKFMLQRYKWVPENPAKSNDITIGFHLSAFYSPVGSYSWQTMAQDYFNALEDPVKMKTFVQTTEGLPFEQEGNQPDYNKLFDRASSSNYSEGQIPNEVCMITIGMDVQNDRIEAEIVGWGKGRRSYSLGYRQYLGRPVEGSEIWEEIAMMLNETFIREDGLVLGVNMALIDEGHHKNDVYAFCLRMGLNKVMPCKGSATLKTPISSPSAVYIKRDGKKSEILKHINVNTDYYKTALYAYLQLSKNDENPILGPKLYCHFPNNYPLEHYKRLTVERQIVVPTSRGFSKLAWQKPSGARNEQLDVRVYAMAAATLMGIENFTDDDFDIVAGNMVDDAQDKSPVKKAPINRLPRLKKIKR